MKNNDPVKEIVAIEEKLQQQIKKNQTNNHLKLKNAQADFANKLRDLKQNLAKAKEDHLKKQATLNQKEINNIYAQAEQETQKIQTQTSGKINQVTQHALQKAKELLCP